MEELLSVIVPVYNVEKYLSRCLDSIINQSYKNIELILIDDGSTDQSGRICDLYAEKDKRIKVIHTENQGQSKARNQALDMANGMYISFVDSDDWIADELYKSVVNLMKKENVDVVDFDCKLTKKYEKNVFDAESYKILHGKEILEEYLEKGVKSQNAPFSPCKKIYKKSLLNDIKFPVGKINEDIATIYKWIMKSNSMIVIDNIGYYYFRNTNSTTVGGFKKRDYDLIDACNELCQLTENENYGKMNYYAKVKRARCYFSLLAKIAYYGIEDSSIDKKQTIKYLVKNLRKNYWLLINSKIALSRKILITAFCINYSLCKGILRLI